ncbi:MAG: DUF2726 domain-containing protein [Lachnospiraceae bacterium]|nr:DUF2726 domain-containing protein [Lachnospiraceae bacterium]
MESTTLEVTPMWDSIAEATAYEILTRKINLEHYQINKHVAVKEIFKSSKKELWSEWHIDFIIADQKSYPVLGIEINGIEHWNNPKCNEKDKIKKHLFESNGIPLVCIPLPELPVFTKEEYKTEYEKALETLIDNFLMPYNYKTSYPAYCFLCGRQLTYRFQKNYTTAFYCCLNKECERETISAKTIPHIIKAKENCK